MKHTETDAHFETHAHATLAEIRRLEGALALAEADYAEAIAALPEATQAAARNLVHYVAMRQLDIRPLQHQLSQLGLSSLGRAEAAVEDAVLRTGNMLRRALGKAPRVSAAQSAEAARSELLLRTQELLGAPEPPAVMVTMPSEAAHDPGLIRGLVDSGMNVMRVNCAHDTEREWRAMVAHLRSAERELSRTCRIVFDLPGPKLRTLDMEPGPRFLHLRPARDEYGRALAVARVFLRGVEGDLEGEPEADELWVPSAWVRELAAGDLIELRDLRGRQRSLRVVRCEACGVECEADRSIYLDEDTRLRALSASGEGKQVRPVRIRAKAQSLRLAEGDLLQLRADDSLGRPAQPASGTSPARPASIACGVPEVLAELRVGNAVLLDDGKISARVERIDAGGALLRIQRTRVGGAKLKAEKGINLPDTDLSRLASLAPADLSALEVAATHADIIGLSFTRSARDVAALHQVLAERGLGHLGVILKVETRAGFEALPQILFEALKRPHVGVMIARGDLAVECGFERLAELQEEMLWLCEAARVPAIWATQVLEGLTKKGQASRAEITDAAMAERAECVMLNKGPYVREAVRSLRDVLSRMRGHQEKKRSMLRPLRSVHLTARDAPGS